MSTGQFNFRKCIWLVLAPPGYRMARLRFASSVFNWGIKDKRAAATQIRLFCDNGRSCCLVCKMCPALCDPVDCSMPGFPVCPSLSPGVCLNSCPLSGWCYLTISSSTTPKVQESKQNSNKTLVLLGKVNHMSKPQIEGWLGYRCVCVCVCVCAQSLTLCEPVLGVAQQTPLSMGFSRQQYWSRLSFPTPGDIPDLGMENASPMSPALAGGYFTLCLESPGLGFDGGNVFCLQEMLRKGSEFFSEWYHLLHCPVFHITCNVHWLYSINARSLIQIHQLEIQYFMIYMI